MTLSRNWLAQAVNQVPSDQSSVLSTCQSVMLSLKKFVDGQSPVQASGAWTVVSSSNSVVAGNADHWSTNADLVWNTPGNAHSWIVLQSPSGFMPGSGAVQLLIDLADGSPYNVVTRVASSAFPFTGGSTTNRPTSTSDTAVGNSNGTTDTSLQWIRNSNDPSAWHATRDSVGDFVFLFGKTGSGYPSTGFFMHALANSEVNDNFPVLFSQQYADDSHAALWDLSGVPRTTQFTGNNPYRSVTLWIDGGNFHPNRFGVIFPEIITDRDGSDDELWLVCLPGTMTSSISGKMYDWSIACACVNENGPRSAFRGQVVDVSWGAASSSGGSQFNGIPQPGSVASGSYDKVIVGNCWVPFKTQPVF